MDEHPAIIISVSASGSQHIINSCQGLRSKQAVENQVLQSKRKAIIMRSFSNIRQFSSLGSVLLRGRSITNKYFLPHQSCRSIFIQTETTPNPHSLKFLPGEIVLPESFGTGMHFSSLNAKETKSSPLAIKLFNVPGIKNVFFGKDFISITKQADFNWANLRPIIFSTIFDYYAEGKPIVTPVETVTDTTILESDSEVVAMIKELLETRIRPAVQEDGGDIFYEGFVVETGMVKIKLAGSCVGCPSSSITLRNGVEKMLKHYIPEVQGIEEIPNDADESSTAMPHDPGHVATEKA
jgi:Fe-S cluster biogenesis protein NfuA